MLCQLAANLFSIESQRGGRQFAELTAGILQALLYRLLLLSVAAKLLEGGFPACKRRAPLLESRVRFKPLMQRLLAGFKLSQTLLGCLADPGATAQAVL